MLIDAWGLSCLQFSIFFLFWSFRFANFFYSIFTLFLWHVLHVLHFLFYFFVFSFEFLNSWYFSLFLLCFSGTYCMSCIIWIYICISCFMNAACFFSSCFECYVCFACCMVLIFSLPILGNFFHIIYYLYRFLRYSHISKFKLQIF